MGECWFIITSPKSILYKRRVCLLSKSAALEVAKELILEMFKSEI